MARSWLVTLFLGAPLLLPPLPARAATVVAADSVLCDLVRTLADGLITVWSGAAFLSAGQLFRPRGAG